MKLINCAALIFATCLLAPSASADNAKTYRITVGRQAKIGPSELQPGEYKVVVDAPAVQLLHNRTGKSIDVKANIETADAKFDNTAITSKLVDGVRQITEIRIGGSKTKLVFDSN